MGSVSAMESINRVLKMHGKEIHDELLDSLPPSLKAMTRALHLDNEIYHISVVLELDDGSVALENLDIDNLAERYPDCKMGY